MSPRYVVQVRRYFIQEFAVEVKDAGEALALGLDHERLHTEGLYLGHRSEDCPDQLRINVRCRMESDLPAFGF